MRIKILTLFPKMLEGILGESILKRAIDAGVCTVELIDMREYSLDKHHHVDDTPYGGGAGMVLACDVVDRAIKANTSSISYKVLMTPQGRPYEQSIAKQFASLEELVLICGHYEGFDERIRAYVDDEISIGDFVLTGGELAAGVICDSVIRLLDHAIRKESSEEDSFSDGLLEYPQYTRPLEYKGVCVPEVLVNGNHKLIKEYRMKESLRKTYLRRSDLLENKELTSRERILLDEVIKEEFLTNLELDQILSFYDVSYKRVTKKINSSQKDFRFSIILDNTYVLKIADCSLISEERIMEMNRLVKRYKEIGVYAPEFIQAKNKMYTTSYKDKLCYVMEYANFPLASELNCNVEDIRRQALKHLGILASKYSNFDLIEAHSMWSIIDLAPLDQDIDEKQENVNMLVQTLKELNEHTLANQIEEFNLANRENILRVFPLLPRCVYQGDLNDSNLLVKNGSFYGVIDFNLSGTEVNINCFLAETNSEPTEEDFKNLEPLELLKTKIALQNEKLAVILENYILTKEEQLVFENYRNLVLISQYPNVCAYQYLLKTEYKLKVIEYLNDIINR